MDLDFWHRRWHKNEIGFHQKAVNRHLRSHWPMLKVPHGGRVFVPLCGKALDLAWLRSQGHPVVGVEVSRLAVEDFFKEHDLQPEAGEEAGLPWLVADDIRIYCGDYFELTPAHLGIVAAVYDRASLIALPPQMRTDYARQLARLTPHGAPVLLVSMEYPEEDGMFGPPFSVHEEEVRNLFENDFDIEQVDTYVDDQVPGHLRERGLKTLTDRVYYLHRNRE